MESEKEYNCPQCHSDRVEKISDDLLCLECGYSFSQQDQEKSNPNQRETDSSEGFEAGSKSSNL